MVATRQKVRDDGSVKVVAFGDEVTYLVGLRRAGSLASKIEWFEIVRGSSR